MLKERLSRGRRQLTLHTCWQDLGELTMRLLLVEDDEMIAETVLDSMRRLGYAIEIGRAHV